MNAPVLSRRDLEFLLYEWLDVTALATRPRFREHSRETFDAFLRLSADIAMEQFAPHNAADGKEGSFYDGKRQAARSLFRYELPKTVAQFDLLAALDTTTLDVHPDWF